MVGQHPNTTLWILNESSGVVSAALAAMTRILPDLPAALMSAQRGCPLVAVSLSSRAPSPLRNESLNVL